MNPIRRQCINLAMLATAVALLIIETAPRINFKLPDSFAVQPGSADPLVPPV